MRYILLAIVLALAACGEVKNPTSDAASSSIDDSGGGGGGDPICVANTTRCAADKVERCAEDGAAWSVQETCANGCNAATGACNGCPVAGANICVGLDSHTCNADMMATTLGRSCGAVGCDPATGKCKTCNPTSNQCGPGEYCQAPNCTSNGYCTPRPASSNPNMDLVCGCDGVTYWNAAHAHFLGVSTGVAGRCPSMTAKTCNADSGAGCATGEYCNTYWHRSGVGCATSSAGNPTHSQCFNKPANFSCPTAPDGNGAQFCAGGCTNDCVGYSSRAWRGAEGCGA